MKATGACWTSQALFVETKNWNALNIVAASRPKDRIEATNRVVAPY